MREMWVTFPSKLHFFSASFLCIRRLERSKTIGHVKAVNRISPQLRFNILSSRISSEAVDKEWNCLSYYQTLFQLLPQGLDDEGWSRCYGGTTCMASSFHFLLFSSLGLYIRCALPCGRVYVCVLVDESVKQLEIR